MCKTIDLYIYSFTYLCVYLFPWCLAGELESIVWNNKGSKKKTLQSMCVHSFSIPRLAILGLP